MFGNSVVYMQLLASQETAQLHGVNKFESLKYMHKN
jgi:hypothetical protein